MRILHIGKFYPPVPGGIESFMGDLLPALHRCGHDVMALVHAGAGDPAADGTFEADRGVWIRRVPCYGNLLYAPVSPAFPTYLAQALRQFRPQVLHLHVPNPSVFWALGMPACRALPWVVHWHADVVSSQIDRRLARAYRFYAPVERYLLHRAARIIVTSSTYLAASAPLQAWRAKCRVIPLGLDAGRLKMPDSRRRAWAEKFWGVATGRILSIGRLTYYKGYNILLQTLHRLPGARLIIAGSGDGQRTLQRQMDHLNLSVRVVLPGYVSTENLQALLATCDLVCLPSLERTEAFGMVLLEAMRYAKPLVASDIPGSGVGWVTGAPASGILVPPADVQALTAALVYLLRHPDVRARMGAAAFQRFQTIFQIEAVAARIAALYVDKTLK